MRPEADPRPLVLVADDDPVRATRRLRGHSPTTMVETSANDYVTKPFSPEALGVRVQAALGR